MIPVKIPNLQDRELYQTIRELALLAAQFNDIVGTGTTLPTSGKRKFFWNTSTKQLMFYTADTSVGNNGWIVIG